MNEIPYISGSKHVGGFTGYPPVPHLRKNRNFVNKFL